MTKNVIIIGAGGHGKSIANIVISAGDRLLGFLDDNKQIGTTIINSPKIDVIGKISDANKYPYSEFIVAVGNNRIRAEIAEKYPLVYYTAIDPSAKIALDVEIGVGTAIMANTCINTSSKIGKHCIINTGTIVEHDNIINDYVHLSPGVTTSGAVNIGEYTHVGTGVTIINNLNIASNVILGAGAVAINDITENGTYVGVPARKIK